MADIVVNGQPLENSFTPWARLPNEFKCQIFRALLNSFTMLSSDVIGWCLCDDPLSRQAYSCACAVCYNMANACPPSYCELPGSFSGLSNRLRSPSSGTDYAPYCTISTYFSNTVTNQRRSMSYVKDRKFKAFSQVLHMVTANTSSKSPFHTWWMCDPIHALKHAFKPT